MDVLIGVIITFLVVILVLYLVNMLPLDARARQIVRAIVIIIGVISLLKSRGVLAATTPRQRRRTSLPIAWRDGRMTARARARIHGCCRSRRVETRRRLFASQKR
jgi:hypothetical protein